MRKMAHLASAECSMAMGSCPSPGTYTSPCDGKVGSEAVVLELAAAAAAGEEEYRDGNIELISEYSQSLIATSRMCCRYLKKRLSLLSPCNIAYGAVEEATGTINNRQ